MEEAPREREERFPVEEDPSPRIVDPALQLIAREQDSLVDFIFRLTGDRARSTVMAKEAALQIESELRSSVSMKELRALCYQRAYELSEESLRPIARSYLDSYYRLQHVDYQTLARFYRWETYLLGIGQHAAILLLLQFRFGFDIEECTAILGHEGLEEEAKVLLACVAQEDGLDPADLKLLPRYGFLAEDYGRQTTLSRVIGRFNEAKRRSPAIALLAILVLSIGVGFALGLMLKHGR